jgi:hypothetical protein
MQTKALAITSAIGAIAVVGLLFAYPAMASSMDGPQNVNVQQLLRTTQTPNLPKVQLSSGQTINLTSVAGGYREVGDPSVNGSATGTLTLQVTGGFVGGYSLSLNGGTIVINGTTYTVSGGSAELGPYGRNMVGQGQGGTSGQFLFHVKDLGRFGSVEYGVLRVDLSDGSSQFIARLLVTISA